MPIDPFDDQKRQAQIGQLRAPAGFDQANWDNPEMDSVKYAAGRRLAGATRPSEIGGIVGGADFQTRFPGATFDGKDRINFNGAPADGARGGVPVHDVDVLMAADRDADTSNGVWWDDITNAQGGGAPQAQAPAARRQGDPIGTIDPAADNSALARIMAELSATSNGEQSPAEREAIMQMLQAI
jgi:hypothetical protein